MTDKQKLFFDNQDLVHFVLKKFTNTPFDYEDLVSIGSIGLIKACNTYNPTKGIKFSSYAVTCIRNEVLMSLRTHNHHNITTVSLETPVAQVGDETIRIGDCIPEPDHESKYSEEEIEFVKQYIDKLPERDKYIVKRYFYDEWTQREISEDIQMSQAHISRKIKVIINKMRYDYHKNFRVRDWE